MAKLSQAAWDAMRALGEFIGSRGDEVGAKLHAWTEAKEAFDAEVKKSDAMVLAAKTSTAEIDDALECIEAGRLEGAINAMRTAKQKLEAAL